MLTLILQAIIPVIFVIGLGYYSGRVNLISQEGARNFSTYIINFALPCTLFVGVFSFTPAQFGNIDYFFTMFVSLLLTFIIGVGMGLYIFKKTVPETSLFACNCGFPDMAYFGLPVLLAVVGTQALLPIIVGNLITSFFIVPAIVLMLSGGQGNLNGKESPTFIQTLITTVKEPIVWAPVLALVLMLLGVTLPYLVTDSIKQLGNTTGGVALFTLGILLSDLKFGVDLETLLVVLLKNLFMPAIAFTLAYLFHLDAPLAKGAVIAMACPAATMGAMFSAKFQVGQNTVPAQILVSNVLGIASMAFWIFIVEKMWPV